ncbi:pantoate--beta-alanine ligase [Steroidobacter sp.]|uniref:pantoate--beta-alanine ligase n=1 Tax=Steroidobacter sp. TaxID=1978227 RepID=UPI001A492A09|nr:pantoate--beta-alanine ligase [Steroidobacter sp.]MBL8269794.1 pantoate--beta-alanine ligase [Steroidobacter sp.]
MAKSLEVVARPHELRERVAQWRRKGERIAFVPTMGNLHAGHGSLVSRATELADHVIVSIFVNPLQFGPNEDFAAYPRTPADDRQLLSLLDAEVLFAPEVDDIYPRGQETTARVHVPGLEDILCGAFRPGHFMGVATVVTKLLNLVQPDVALFGEKDFQQLMIIRRAAIDLCMPVEIVGVQTTREPDGLAMSSRNRYLKPEQRAVAPQIFAALQRTRLALESGSSDYAALEKAGTESLQKAGFRPDYFAVRDANTLQLPEVGSKDLVVVTAARIGRARLIDNVRAQRA